MSSIVRISPVSMARIINYFAKSIRDMVSKSPKTKEQV